MLLWIKQCTRALWGDLFIFLPLDLIFLLLSLVRQFMHQPKEAHLQVTLRIIQYLKGTLERRILFKRNENVSVEAYIDFDHAGSIMNRKSITRYCTFLGGNLVTWKSKRV